MASKKGNEVVSNCSAFAPNCSAGKDAKISGTVYTAVVKVILERHKASYFPAN